MADVNESNRDDVLMNLLLEDKTLVGFLFSIFGFLARRTDFYVIKDDSSLDDIGFPPGVSEELVIKVLKKCNPFSNAENEDTCAIHYNSLEQIEDNIYMPTAVAEEVEIETTEDIETTMTSQNNTDSDTHTDVQTHVIHESLTKPDISEEMNNPSNLNFSNLNINCTSESIESTPHKTNEIQSYLISDHNTPEISSIPECNNYSESQKHSESYNGAQTEKYSWSQKIGELDVTIDLPNFIKSAKQLKVNITSDAFFVQFVNSESDSTIFIKDNFLKKVKQAETLWVMSEGKLRIHLEKQKEGWWNALLENEKKIDTTKIDCSRPLDELPEDHIAKVRELQWNQMQKLAGKPTSDEIKQQNILKKAWNMPGSPFINTPFDPSVLNK